MNFARPRSMLIALVGVALVALTASSATSASVSSPARHHPTGHGRAPLDRVFVIMLENHSKSSVIGDPNAPFITHLAHKYTMADHYFGVTHPSMPNYVAAIAGDNFGIQDDNDQNVVNLDRRNLVDQLEAHHIRWGAYMETLPADKLARFAPSESVALRSCSSTTSSTTRLGWHASGTTAGSPVT
jgi:phosphatidylinositol-3-phosphatase